MARVTVEDCVQKIPNRFELVLLAAQRARNLARGEEITLDRDDDKNPVVALREIADETITVEKLEQDLIKSLSRAPEFLHSVRDYNNTPPFGALLKVGPLRSAGWGAVPDAVI